jgi:hypothetical protein
MNSARSPTELVDATAAEHGARVVDHGAPVELTTPEGEIASIAWASLDNGSTCAAAVVAGVMSIDAIAVDAYSLVTPLVQELGVGLGDRRRRAFVCAPPADWRRVDHPSFTAWCHPSSWSVATVFLARPYTATVAERLDRELFAKMPSGFHSRRVWPFEDVTSNAGLVGRLRIESGHRRGVDAIRMAASFGDDRFLYLAHFEGHARDADAFRALVATFQPVPRTFTGIWHE